ncbi:MAG: sensor histidine kinase [Brockia lithotrophica]|nr:sensor histidine kinase [Brockia lithotrophica]
MEEGTFPALETLERILDHTVRTMEAAKAQVFDIAEQAREESRTVEEELAKLKREIEFLIAENDRREREYRKLRQRLVEVSRNFSRYTERDIREAYEAASEMLATLQFGQEREKLLRKRRDELEQRYKNLLRTIDKAESILLQMSVVLDYLKGDLARMSEAVQSALSRQLFGFKVIEAQEEERRRIARDIHDGPAQSLALALLKVELVEKRIREGDAPLAAEELRSLRDILRATLADVRKVIYDLRPMHLDDLGLVSALARHLELYRREGLPSVELHVVGEEQRLTGPVEIALFRIVQEAVANAVKHAEARLVSVEIAFLPHVVRATVADDGKGFVPEKVREGRKTYGLMGIVERAKLVGGKASVLSEPGRGTIVTVEVPRDVGADAGE